MSTKKYISLVYTKYADSNTSFIEIKWLVSSIYDNKDHIRCT